MKFIICLLGLLAALSLGRAESLRFAGTFTDHAVLQRGVPLPVSGVATPGEHITVTLGATQARTTAGADGIWTVTLPAQAPGGPWVLAAEGTTKVELQDILVGDVWFCSGQSNMASMLKSYATAVEMAAINEPGVRVFTQWPGGRRPRRNRTDIGSGRRRRERRRFRRWRGILDGSCTRS